MAAGVTDKLWEMTDVVKMIEAYERGDEVGGDEKTYGGTVSVGPKGKTTYGRYERRRD